MKAPRQKTLDWPLFCVLYFACFAFLFHSRSPSRPLWGSLAVAPANFYKIPIYFIYILLAIDYHNNLDGTLNESDF